MVTTSTPTRQMLTLGAAVLLAATGLAGCSSDSTTASSSSSAPATASASASTAVCADADALQASVNALVNTKVIQEGTSAVQTRFATVQSDAQNLIATAKDEFAPETSALESSLTALQTAVQGLTDSPSAADAAAVAAALGPVKNSAQELVDAVKGTC